MCRSFSCRIRRDGVRRKKIVLDNTVPELRGLIVNVRDVLHYGRTSVVGLCVGCETSKMKRIVITKYLRHCRASYYGVVEESSVGAINI